MVTSTPSRKVIWQPQAGPQEWFIRCPCDEILFGGARGGGKTSAALGDWAIHANTYKQHAAGVFFRRTMPELEEVIKQARDMYLPIGAVWLEQKKTFIMPGGALLKLRYLERDSDADRYQGHQYTWICFEEMGNWKLPDAINKLRGTLRSAHGVPVRFLGTANPGGSGHHWINERYMLGKTPRVPWYDAELGTWVVYIPALLTDNKILMDNDPGYRNRLKGSGPPWLVRAWLHGDWSVVPNGGWFDVSAVVREPGAQIRRQVGRPVLAIDPAVSTDTGDDTAFAIGGSDDKRRLNLMFAKGQKTSSEVWVDDALRLAVQYDVSAILMEGGPIGVGIKPWLLKRMRELGIHRDLIMISHMHDKGAKNSTAQATMGHGCMVVPDKAEWYDRFLMPQFMSFHPDKDGVDDGVDAVGILARHVEAMYLPEVPKAKPQELDFKKHQKKTRRATNTVTDIIEKPNKYQRAARKAREKATV